MIVAKSVVVSITFPSSMRFPPTLTQCSCSLSCFVPQTLQHSTAQHSTTQPDPPPEMILRASSLRHAVVFESYAWLQAGGERVADLLMIANLLEEKVPLSEPEEKEGEGGRGENESSSTDPTFRCLKTQLKSAQTVKSPENSDNTSTGKIHERWYSLLQTGVFACVCIFFFSLFRVTFPKVIMVTLPYTTRQTQEAQLGRM